MSADATDFIVAGSQGSYANVPPHVVGLSYGEDVEMFLDTHLGVIYFPEPRVLLDRHV
jgi:hypothetical protein